MTEKAEPVAWRWRHVNDPAQSWTYQTRPIEGHNEYLQVETLFTAPPRCDAQSVRAATIEECAKVCDLHAQWAVDKIPEYEAPDSERSQLFATIGNTAADCAGLIRTLSGVKPAQGDADMTNQAPELLPEGDPQILAKLLRAIAGGTDAQSSRHDVIFLTAADWLDRWDTRPSEKAESALRDIISTAKDAQAVDALGDIVRRAEEELTK